MKAFLIAIAVLFAVGVPTGHAEKKERVAFEATVVRLDNWGLMKFTCGVAINLRLAEYKVETVYHGHITPGDRIVVQHIACNWNELDGLNVGDRVFVVAEFLKRPEKMSWKPKLDEQSFPHADRSEPETIVELPLKSEIVLVRYNAIRVAKVVYPTKP